MITLEELRTGDPRDTANGIADVVHALIQAARLALESDSRGKEPIWVVSVTLELADELMKPLCEGVEHLTREAERGFWKEKCKA